LDVTKHISELSFQRKNNIARLNFIPIGEG